MPFDQSQRIWSEPSVSFQLVSQQNKAEQNKSQENLILKSQNVSNSKWLKKVTNYFFLTSKCSVLTCERPEIIFKGIFQRRRGEITRFVGSAVLELTTDVSHVWNSNFTGSISLRILLIKISKFCIP